VGEGGGATTYRRFPEKVRLPARCLDYPIFNKLPAQKSPKSEVGNSKIHHKSSKMKADTPKIGLKTFIYPRSTLAEFHY